MQRSQPTIPYRTTFILLGLAAFSCTAAPLAPAAEEAAPNDPQGPIIDSHCEEGAAFNDGCLHGKCVSGVAFGRVCKCTEHFGTLLCDNYSKDYSQIGSSLQSLPLQIQELAVLTTELASMAYYAPVKCWDGQAPAGISELKTHTLQGDWLALNYAASGIVSSRNLPFVAFRGTDTENQPQEWLQDFNWWTYKRSFDGQESRVHQGFYNVVQSNLAELVQIAKDVMAKAHKQEILITGHSLGGALSEMFAVRLKEQVPGAKIYLMTIGKPRVGDASWAQTVQRLTEVAYRLVNTQHSENPYRDYVWDIATQVPNYSTVVPGAVYYMHPGTQLNLGGGDGSYQLKDPDSQEISPAFHSDALYSHRVKQLVVGMALDVQLCPGKPIM
eukprot:TRINITY_DN7304_c0_g1_i2.p1 TRINITY_DN7304_c0_g1~~TRINITY_DN7304_c0_g1_i2.p1  ORF type:complete len:385 (+),score=105.66 TRINITY_DN7304_c0_g1_i2:80-1234(+)